MAEYNLYDMPMDNTTQMMRRQILDAPMAEGTNWGSIGRAVANTAPRAAEMPFGAIARGAAMRALPYATMGARALGLPETAAMYAGTMLGHQVQQHLPIAASDAIGGTINQGMRRLGLGGVDDSNYLAQNARAALPTADPYTSALQGGMRTAQSQYNQNWGGMPRRQPQLQVASN